MIKKFKMNWDKCKQNLSEKGEPITAANKMEEYSIEYLNYVRQNIDKINAVFEEVLKKKGDTDRDIAKREILQSLFYNLEESYAINFKDGYHLEFPKLRMLIYLSNLVELAYNRRYEDFIASIKALPWNAFAFDEDNTAYIVTNFVWWLLDYESKEKVADKFLPYYTRTLKEVEPSEEAKKFVYEKEPFKREGFNLEFLINYNKEKKATRERYFSTHNKD